MLHIGMLKVQTKINQAHTCPGCGYIELYLNAQEMRSKIA